MDAEGSKCINQYEYSAEAKLDAVILSDRIVDPRFFEECVQGSLTIALSKDLHAHVLSQGLQLPAHSTITRWKVDLDLASMLWSRIHVLTNGVQTHIRCDCSPQGGRDFMVTVLDVLPPLCVSWKQVAAQIQVRMLPVQFLGSRASSLAHKFNALMRQISLECGNTKDFLRGVRSILTDMGTESGFWSCPADAFGTYDATTSSFELYTNTMLPCALPFADTQHQMHHARRKKKFFEI